MGSSTTRGKNADGNTTDTSLGRTGRRCRDFGRFLRRRATPTEGAGCTSCGGQVGALDDLDRDQRCFSLPAGVAYRGQPKAALGSVRQCDDPPHVLTAKLSAGLGPVTA